jgi:hypothetical protein
VNITADSATLHSSSIADPFSSMDLSSQQDNNKVNGEASLVFGFSSSSVLYNRAVAVFTTDDRMLGCAVTSPSVFAAPGANMTDVGQVFSYDGAGYNMGEIQGHAVVVHAAGGEVVGCGRVPGDPYKTHPSVSHYSHSTAGSTKVGTKKVTTTFEIDTGYGFEEYEGKPVVLTDGNGKKVACGILKGTEGEN